MTSHLTQYRRNQDGNVVMIFALMLLPILAVVGFNVDFNRQSKSVNHLQAAMDAAALVGAKELANSANSLADVRRLTIENFHANILSADADVDCNDPNVEIDQEDFAVRVTGGCKINSLFGETFWNSDLSVGNHAQAKVAVTHLDLSLMLDVSGSMSGSKLAALKTAAIEAAETLITPQTGDRVRVGFATYSNSVNVRDFAQQVLNTGQLSHYLNLEDSDGNSIFDLGDDICVKERSGGGLYQDNVPHIGSSRFPVLGIHGSCPSSTISPLTSDLNSFKSRINALSAGGMTAGHQGIGWGWYIMSPNWSSVWPASANPLPYGDDRKKKALIIMTDGEFNQEHNGIGSATQARRLCDNIRAEEVIVYTVAFELNNAAAEATLKDCADLPTRFFKADNAAELIEAYQRIASELRNLRLSE